jgi:2-oxoglutarate ferredoxin oxidoreductase subunit beta
MRRGVNMTYMVMNNGVYGLTKGQFSATADKGSVAKKGAVNNDSGIDLASLAILMGATFVARSFSGDKAQLVPLIKAAISHPGAAILDVISPCVAFNNHKGSTRSYDYVRAHNEALNRLDVIAGAEPIAVDYAPGSTVEIMQPNGTLLRLSKISPDYDPSDKAAALAHIQDRASAGEVATGLLYYDPEGRDLHARMGTAARPLNTLDETALCPGSARLDAINAALR